MRHRGDLGREAVEPGADVGDGVDRIEIGPKETLQFSQDVKGAKYPWRFLAANMSDGTLRALGVLVALRDRYLRLD